MALAFLSHSSQDKPYVDIVAQRLSRARLVYDRQSFEPGEDFRDLIRNGLDKSSVFVLFASARSLASDWVKFELDEAEIRKITGKIKTFLVVVIDAGLKPADLPLWMQRGLFCPQTRPSQAARLILSKLMQFEGSDQRTLFVGREDLLSEVAGMLPPPGGLPPPQILVFSGLDGVGRRSAATRAFRDYLSLAIGPTVMLEDTDDTSSLYLQLLEDASAFTSRDEYKDAIKGFKSASLPDQAKLIAREIEKVAKDNTALLIVDQGSLIEDSGMFKPQVAQIFAEVTASGAEPYVAVIQRRRPPLAQTSPGRRISSFAVPPLSLDATRRLLVQTLKSATGMTPDEKHIQDLTPYMDGYPPAVQLAVAYAKRYGIDTLIADKSALVDLKVRTFDRVLKKLELDALEQLIVRVLGVEPSLSLDVLATMTGAPSADLVPKLTRLIDNSVVVRHPDTISLAAPMRDAVYREFGYITPAEYGQFARRLKANYWKDPNALPSLDAIDATLYTSARAHDKEFEDFADIAVPSLLLKVATSAYHEKDYKVARDFAQRATSADPKLERGWIILTKAYIRLAHEGAAEWSQAEAVLAQLKEHRVRHYLAGFLNWKRGDFKAAVQHFTAAENAGDRGVAVYRDRAYCRFQLGQIDDAQKDIKIALDRYPRNPFIVDLAAAIAIRSGDYKKAEDFLRDLAEVEPKKENYHHRLATFYAAKGQFPRALVEADVAAKRQPPLHEILANRIDILIELGRYPLAIEELDVIEKQFKGKTFKDVQAGLRCKLALRQNKWREAEGYFTALHNKESPVHRSLKAELLKQKSSDPAVAVLERQAARAESQALIEALKAAGAALWLGGDEPDAEE